MARRKRQGRSDKGGGSITALPNGKYRVDIEIPTRPGEPRRRKSRTVASRAAAVIARRELLNSIEVGVDAVVPDILVADWIDSRHALYAGRDVSAGAIDSHERAGRLHLAPHFAGVKVADLTAQHIEALLNNWTSAKLGKRSQEIAYRVLRHAIEDARSSGMLAVNPLERIKPPQARRKVVDPFTEAQARQIIAAVQGDRLEALWALLFATGMRVGEALALSPAAINIERREVRIERTGKYRGGELLLRPPKTDRSKRTISVPGAVAEKLARHLDSANRDFVFANRAGNMIDVNGLRSRQWERLLKAANVSHKPIHQIRHTYATLTLMAGVPVHVVSAVLGHASPSITLDLYSHYLPAHQDVAVSAAEKLFID